MRIGTAALIASVAGLAAVIILRGLMGVSTPLRILGAAFEGAFIGAVCDTIALKLLFFWLLPAKKADIARGLAAKARNDWLAPERIRSYIDGERLDIALTDYLRRLPSGLQGDAGRPALEKIAEGLSGVLRDEKTALGIENAIRNRVPGASSLGFMGNAVLAGMVPVLIELADREVKNIPVPGTAANLRTVRLLQTAADKVHEANLRMDDAARSEMIDALLRDLLPRVSEAVGEIVEARIAELDPKAFAREFESDTGRYLDYIRVSGAVFGLLFGAAAGLAAALFG